MMNDRQIEISEPNARVLRGLLRAPRTATLQLRCQVQQASTS
jgi:hypothetical protein